MEINQEHLQNAISDLEKGYVSSVIELIKIPVFNRLIDKDLKDAKGDRKKDLENAKANNTIKAKGHEESLDSLGEIITEAKKLLT